MSIKMITKISEKFEDYPSYLSKKGGPYVKTAKSNSVVNRQHVQTYDKNGDVTYVTGTYQTGGGSGYKLLLYTVFECVTQEITDDLIVIFEYPTNHSQTAAFKKAERTLKKMTKGFKNIRIMNWEQFEKWNTRWKKSNKVGAQPTKKK